MNALGVAQMRHVLREGGEGEGRERGGEGGGASTVEELVCHKHCYTQEDCCDSHLLCKGEYLPLIHSTKLGIHTKVVFIKGLQGEGGGAGGGAGGEGEGQEG